MRNLSLSVWGKKEKRKTRVLYKQRYFTEHRHKILLHTNRMSTKATGHVVGKDGCEADTFQGNEVLIVKVQNTGRMDASSITLGEQRITLKTGDTFPISFSVEYDEEEAKHIPDYGFTLDADIKDDQDKLLYTNDTRTSARSKEIQVKKTK